MENWHLEKFKEFCHYEKLYGGPDPHMCAVIYMCKSVPEIEKLWRVHCYVGLYNVPSAEAVWREWPGECYLRNSERIESWFENHWKGFRLRRERRTVKSPSRLAKYFIGYETVLQELPRLRNADPEEIWQFANSLPHVGRYAATKLLECWHRLGLIENTVCDIRAKGGWSPRSTLAMIAPEMNHDPYDNSEFSVKQADFAVKLLHGHVSNISIFELEVMLCEYKASYKTHRQYPGRSADSELEYERAIEGYWNVGETDHMKTRKVLHPPWVLGEIQGWKGVRKDLGYVLANHGYTWSDSLYDYMKTLDLAKPARR